MSIVNPTPEEVITRRDDVADRLADLIQTCLDLGEDPAEQSRGIVDSLILEGMINFD